MGPRQEVDGRVGGECADRHEGRLERRQRGHEQRERELGNLGAAGPLRQEGPRRPVGVPHVAFDAGPVIEHEYMRDQAQIPGDQGGKRQQAG